MMKKDRIEKYIKPLKPFKTQLSKKGKRGKKIRAVIFDVYGTLFISGSGDIGLVKTDCKKTNDIELLMKKFSINGTGEKLLKDFFSSIQNEHHILKTKGFDYPEVETDRIWMTLLNISNRTEVRMFAAEFEMIINPAYPMPNLEKILGACRDKGLYMGIISNAQFYTKYLFKWFLGKNFKDLGFHSELVFLSYKYGYAKPSRFMFRLAADKLKKIGIPADSVIYIGNDMLNDIYPANQEGFLTALFAGDARSLRMRENDPRCSSLEPDYIVNDLIQLADFI
jgi:putative hydrolase of the HAD superfamily